MKRLALVLALLLATEPALANSGDAAGFETGGLFPRFDWTVDRYNASGKPFHILGYCASACTLFLGIKNVCVGRGATFMFHGAHDRLGNVVPGSSGVRHLLDAYNPALQTFLLSNHCLDTAVLRPISGVDMIEKFGYPECPAP